MGESKKLSFSFRLLRKLGFNYSEEAYGQVSLWSIISKVVTTYRNAYILSWMNSWLLSPFLPRKLRPAIMRKVGCHVGKGCFIGDNVKIDSGHADLITLEDNVSIAGGTRLLCHQRDFSDYCVGDDYMKLGYTLKPIHLCKGCLVGMESFVMPGVTIGEGAIVGAGSLVTKDVPAWTVAMGRPAKIVKQIKKRKKDENTNL